MNRCRMMAVMMGWKMMSSKMIFEEQIKFFNKLQIGYF